MSNAIHRILSSATVRPTEEPTEYRAFVDSGGRPQMAFSLCRANGNMDGFLYHALDNIAYETRGGLEFLSFNSRAKLVTIQGQQIAAIYRAMIRHTLMEIRETDGRAVPKDQPVVTGVAISILNAPAAPTALRLAK